MSLINGLEYHTVWFSALTTGGTGGEDRLIVDGSGLTGVVLRRRRSMPDSPGRPFAASSQAVEAMRGVATTPAVAQQIIADCAVDLFGPRVLRLSAPATGGKK